MNPSAADCGGWVENKRLKYMEMEDNDGGQCLTPARKKPTNRKIKDGPNKGIYYSNKSYKWDNRNKKCTFENSKG